MSAVQHSSPQITAVLGPTNTGKTHFAMERMLGHSSGMIGFPLRLLARENYDRAVALKGAGKVALVTGEEKIVPPGACYFLCTVEAMPLDRPVEFLAIDEIQMCADPDRGHVFTDRLLHARGREETMFLGASSMASLIRRLVRGVEIVTRPRLSKLRYAGPTKVSKLHARSAVVAFTVNDVYALAELVRRQRGGAAVVLGALSPRTRNAQVEMYQNGEVDYLVATDAIGMGLNMDVDHVAFASTRKYDGKRFRQLNPAELAQTAGRAGRHTNDGTFGTTADVGPLDEETIGRIENHEFPKLSHVYWRNPDIVTNTLDALKASLRTSSGVGELARVREADDERALIELSRDPHIVEIASNADAVSLLWDVCQIPDFEKEWTIGHARLLEQIYGHLSTDAARLPDDYIADHVGRIDQTGGDIDALSSRIARIRTWTYVSHKVDWLDDAVHWQERTRVIEDKLSDALHERLTQRFVDKRTTLLVSKLRSRGNLLAVVKNDGDVLIEGQYVGRLRGLRFEPDATRFNADRQALAGAAAQALRNEVKRRIDTLSSDDAASFTWRHDGRIDWGDEPIAHLRRGGAMLQPEIDVLTNDYIDAPERERLRRRLDGWVRAQTHQALAPLFETAKANVTGAARGVVYQLNEQLGSVSREAAGEQVDALSRDDRKLLKTMGLRIGRSVIYMPALLKPKAVEMRARLWNIWHQPVQTMAPPPAGRITIEVPASKHHGAEKSFLAAIGYQVFRAQDAAFAVRLDMVERIAGMAWTLGLKAPFAVNADLMSLAGSGEARVGAILQAIGFQRFTKGELTLYRVPRHGGAANEKNKEKAKGKSPQKRNAQSRRKSTSEPDVSDSPFAVLKDLRIGS